MVDMAGVPQRLKQDICKSQGEQVLDGFLAEIMVNSENPVLAKGAGDGIVNVPACVQRDTKRLFKANPAHPGRKATARKPGNGLLKQ